MACVHYKMQQFPLNVNRFHHHASRRHQLGPALDTEPKPPIRFLKNDRSRKYIMLGRLRLPQHSSAHLSQKITFQSRIWISTCCYGNRHPFLPAGLVWPELVESFKKKKKKESFTYRCFSH